MVLFHEALCIHQNIQQVKPIQGLRMPAGMRVNTQTPSSKLLKRGH